MLLQDRACHRCSTLLARGVAAALSGMAPRLSDMACPPCRTLLCSCCSPRPPSCLEITQDMHHFRSQLMYFSARVHFTSCSQAMPVRERLSSASAVEGTMPDGAHQQEQVSSRAHQLPL